MLDNSSFLSSACQNIPDVGNNLIESSDNIPPYMPGAEISYACNNGFTLYGVERITCDSEGKWSSSNPPVCRKSMLLFIQL